MTDNDWIAHIGQRVSEINVWISLQGLYRLTLLVTAIALLCKYIKENTYEYLLLAAFASICIGFVEGTFHWNIHMNGNNAKIMEENLSKKEGSHEHLRSAQNRTPSQHAALGSVAPFIILFLVCLFGIYFHREQIPGAGLWIIALMTGASVSGLYYLHMTRISP